MKLSKIQSNKTLLIITIIGSVFFVTLALVLNMKMLVQIYTVLITENIIPPQREQKPSSLPHRLIIPEINVDSIVEYVGVTAGGAMDTPKSPTTTAWFNMGQRPGENGSAVISGHFGWKNGIHAVFDNLHKLKIGDKIYVVADSGITSSFVVREIKSYDQNADASDVFVSTDGVAHLNLVTCQGVWSNSEKSYSKRLVVFTDKE